MLAKITKRLGKDSIVSLNVLTYVILFIVPFSPTWWFWPYPLQLAVLDPIFYRVLDLPPTRTPISDVGTLVFLVAVWIIGLSLAFFVGKHFSRWNRQRNQPWFMYWWTPLVWFGILILIEAAVFIFVTFGLGIPVGV